MSHPPFFLPESLNGFTLDFWFSHSSRLARDTIVFCVNLSLSCRSRSPVQVPACTDPDFPPAPIWVWWAQHSSLQPGCEILGASAMDEHLRARAFGVPGVGTYAIACHVLGQLIPFPSFSFVSSFIFYITELSPMHPAAFALCSPYHCGWVVASVFLLTCLLVTSAYCGHTWLCSVHLHATTNNS